MKAASLKEIKSELARLEPDAIQELCLRLSRFKKENKELLTYLLFDASDEKQYIQDVKDEIIDNFSNLPLRNVYYVKKSLRKVLRFANKHIRYSGSKTTEIEIRICFCMQMKEAKIPLQQGTQLFNIYKLQVTKINKLLDDMSEDMQADYQREVDEL